MVDEESVEKTLKKVLLEVSLKIAKEGKGCILVIRNNNVDYEELVQQDIPFFNVIKEQRRLERLAKEDGACIISPDGELIAYSAQITNTKPFKPFGTRHSAGFTASQNGNMVFLASEEDKKVRVFANGDIISEIDTQQPDVEKKTGYLADVFQSLGAGTIAMITLGGASALIPQLPGYISVPLIPGVILFAAIHASIKYFKNNPQLRAEKKKKAFKYFFGSIFIIGGLWMAILNFPQSISLVLYRYHAIIGAFVSIFGLVLAFAPMVKK